MLLHSHFQARYALVLFILFFFAFSTITCSQRISLNVNHQPLIKVFRLIEQQSDFIFLYTRETVDKGELVTIHVSNGDIDTVLGYIFRDQPLLDFKIDGNSILILRKSGQGQFGVHSLNGRIVNDRGEPVAGLTVSIPSRSLVTTTDFGGVFYFPDVPESAKLKVSGAEIEPIDTTVFGRYIDLTVTPRIDVLDAPIVIAYGKTTQRYSTSSISSISGTEIKKQTNSNPILSLAGKVSGLQVSQISGAPGTTISVRLRGLNSISNGSNPLFLVDGVPFPSTTLNNGVGGVATTLSPLDNINPADIASVEILKDADATAIYGSRGANGVILITTKRGDIGQTRLTVQAATGIGSITRQMPLLSTSEYLNMRREAFANDHINPTVNNAPDLLVWDTARYTDWQKVLIGNSVHQTDVTASLTGGSKYTQFLFSGTYHKETTVFPGSFSEEKVSGLFTLHHSSENGRLNIDFTSSYLFNTNRLPREDITPRVSLPPNSPEIYNGDGTLNWENNTWVNPFSVLRRSFTNQTRVLSANSIIQYNIIKGLQFQASFGYTVQNLKEFGQTPRSSYSPSSSSQASATFGRTDLTTLISEPRFSYSHSWGGHFLECVGGVSILQTDQSNVSQTGTGYSSDALLHSIKSAATITTPFESFSRYRYVGVFGRASYRLKSKYLATLTVRRDGSSRYGTENRFANFYSAGVGWIFSKETWLSKCSWLSFGKLHGSFGRTGNDQIGDYKYLDLYGPITYSYQSVVPFAPSQLFNPKYSWEEVLKQEIGLNLGFFKDRYKLSFTYYLNTTTNQLIQYPLSTVTGFSGILENLPASIKNTGVEIECSGVLIQHKKFSWEVSANLTLPKNRLAKFDGLGSSSYANVYVVGLPLTIVKKFAFDKLDPSTGIYKFIDFNGNGTLDSPQDEQAIVDVSQKYFGGLQSAVTVGRFSASILFQFVRQPFGGNWLVRFGMPGSLSNQPTWISDRWRNPGDNASYQRLAVSDYSASLGYSFYQYSNAGYSNASFIRLRNLYVSYDVSSSIIRKMHLQGASVFLQGNNLLTITRYRGFDPETQTFLPPVKVLLTGIKLTF